MKRGSARGPGGKKSGGVASSRACDAAEKSPAVYFANLKADMMLQKQMQVLKRAESSFVRLVVIDQKIVFRRFQAKLHRSKIARARLWDDKETERELRASDLHVMNTRCGQEQDDFEFFKKMEYRPCIVDDLPSETGKLKQVRKMPEVTDKEMEDFIRAVLDEQAPSPTVKKLQNLSTNSRLMEEAKLVHYAEFERTAAERGSSQTLNINIRPVTTPALRTDPAEGAAKETAQPTRKTRGRVNHSLEQGRNDKENRPQSSQAKDYHSISGTDKNKLRPLTSPAQSRFANQKKGSRKPSTCTWPVTKRTSTHGVLRDTTSSPGQKSARQPFQAATSMFKEQKKVDMVALRLDEARSTDFTSKVSSFIKSLLELDRKERTRCIRTDATGGEPGEGFEETGREPESEPDREDKEERKEEPKGDRKFDYYATKMALYAASVKKDPRVSLPGTPEEMNMRLVGDQTIKNITMPRLHFDYDLKEQGMDFCGPD